jgi:hypothetical protein
LGDVDSLGRLENAASEYDSLLDEAEEQALDVYTGAQLFVTDGSGPFRP